MAGITRKRLKAIIIDSMMFFICFMLSHPGIKQKYLLNCTSEVFSVRFNI